jgi:hypothetical protein
MVSGLVQRLGSLSFISDNAAMAGLSPGTVGSYLSVPTRCTWGLREFAGIWSRCWWRQIRLRICWLTLGVALAK